MLVSRTDQSIVQATIGLAHTLDMRAVAEGIEDPAQAEQLRALGCDLMQGFHIGRPMSMDQLQEWLERRPVRDTPERDPTPVEPPEHRRPN